MEIKIADIDGLPGAAREFLDALHGRRVVAFHGEMGAGKTTFISALCRLLGVGETAASPSFAIINEYRGTDGPIYHFDFYRLDSARDAMEIGAEEYFYSGALCLIEWPERVEEILPEECVHVNLHVDPVTDARVLSFD